MRLNESSISCKINSCQEIQEELISTLETINHQLTTNPSLIKIQTTSIQAEQIKTYTSIISTKKHQIKTEKITRSISKMTSFSMIKELPNPLKKPEGMTSALIMPKETISTTFNIPTFRIKTC